jgi:hypothetical protein
MSISTECFCKGIPEIDVKTGATLSACLTLIFLCGNSFEGGIFIHLFGNNSYHVIWDSTFLKNVED